ncbi:CheW domain-containing protein [Pseudomonas panipatensis]|uniref:Purine-binding chemotaxis protein CheW n=1 Tax=Pseudomonas panipatensis TaxID=428992 RepID=A0A1G8GAE7_9PSED|nr:CheW domain-containing protein [Pseudomonas panipatensis]SDH91345.1 purine-binding chemotaxis protein CheW [Pseudomonas panipatensis]SMP44532.1 purine-binding chemotaxis protein CheW [Pseudomonas panipatensis]
MSRSATATRPQIALQSYLDALLQEATFEEVVSAPAVLEPVVLTAVAAPIAVEVRADVTADETFASSVSLDEFEAAVLEEQVRDARLAGASAEPVVIHAPREPLASPVLEPPAPAQAPLSAQVIELHRPGSADLPAAPLALLDDGRPLWAAEPFECLLFDVAGLTLAVPLVCLGSIYPLSGQELTPLFGQPDWFLGILPSQAGNLKVLDTARWVMPERYRDDYREGLQYVISVQGYEWGLAVHQVSRSVRLDPSEVKWRNQRVQRPWLAGTVIEQMCALLDVSALAELIASGAARNLPRR